MYIKLKPGADILDALEDLSASTMTGLIDKRKMTDSARKELQREGLLFPRSTDKTPLGVDVCRAIRKCSQQETAGGARTDAPSS